MERHGPHQQHGAHQQHGPHQENRGKPRYSSRFRLKNVYPRVELSHLAFETETDYCNLNPSPLIPSSAIWMTSTTDTLKSASYSDLCQEIYDEGRSRTKLSNKVDDLIFSTVNFSFICCNIPAAHVYEFDI